MTQASADPLLVSPTTLGRLALANRIVVSPMGQHSAFNGVPNDWHLAHLGQLGVSGAGLVITEAVAVDPRGRISPGCMGLWTDDQIPAHTRILDFVRQNDGARMGVQLGHSGRKGSVSESWHGQESLLPGEGGWEILNASARPYPGRTRPVALDEAGIDEAIRAFADSAGRAARAGYDMIEIHAAHGYLIHSFLTPLMNDRDDDWGGSLENRMRFGLDVFRAVRESFPADRPVGVRVSATDWIEGGWSEKDTVRFATELKTLGCDYICASTGGVSPEQEIPVGPRYQVPFAECIRRETGLKTMAVGLITDPKDAEAILQEGRADLIAIGRAMLYNPRWAWHAAEVLGGEAPYPKQYARAHPSMRRNNAFVVRR